MLLLLTMVEQFFATHILKTSSKASSVVSAHNTLAPRFVIAVSKLSNCLSSVSIAFHFKFFAFSLALSSWVNCCLPTGTTALYFAMLKLILRLCSISEALAVLLVINEDELSDILIYV